MSVRVPLPGPILETRLVVILRGLGVDDARAAIETLARCRVRALEITLDSPGAISLVGAARERGLLAGAGTVRGLGDAGRALSAGASYLVCPHTDAALLRWCGNKGVPVLAGAATATEALTAWNAGAAAIKLFPAAQLGVDYMKALREPLADLPFVPTGGIGVANAPLWLEAGAVAVAVGGEVTRAARTGELEMVARQLVAATCERERP